MADTHHTPPVWSDERMHELTRDCWCNPTVVTGPTDDADAGVFHKKMD